MFRRPARRPSPACTFHPTPNFLRALVILCVPLLVTLRPALVFGQTKNPSSGSFKVGARIMGQVGYRLRPEATVNAERHRGSLTLRQMRVKFSFKREHWRLKASVDLADGISADGTRPFRFVRNAYAQWNATRQTRLRVGLFKRPYSRLAWNSAGDTPTISRGLTYRYAIRQRNTNLAYGMRGMGLMLWQKYKSRLGKGRVYASVTQSGLDLRSWSAHVMLRQALGSSVELDLYGAYKRSLVAGQGVHSNAAGLSLSVQHRSLYALAEVHALQNWQIDSRPWGLGALATANYMVVNTPKVKFGPMTALEFLEEELKSRPTAKYRAATGLLLETSDTVKVWLEGEWIDHVQDTNIDDTQAQFRLRLQLMVSL